MSLDSAAKIEIAKKKKDSGDAAFKAGEIKEALRGYHEALLYLNGIDKSAVQSMVSGGAQGDEDEKNKSEVDEMLEKIYANQSACHIKNQNWKRAIEAADKALSKNEKNHKAGFRKGKALAELGFTEKAEKTLTDLLGKKPSPTDAATINAELQRIRSADAARMKKHENSLRGFLSRNKDSKVEESEGTTPSVSKVETA
ncbi:hypothetical protein Clacol_002903 [Clathrus columnatus]|uniref:TPR-like protein n=1 Tax=Clathrus columnatus TaxID=1419009 RepID=A0AAV5A218_9AGAM|nr:hypothetical protein Clacol_002903 [Clathrus columnatus]